MAERRQIFPVARTWQSSKTLLLAVCIAFVIGIAYDHCTICSNENVTSYQQVHDNADSRLAPILFASSLPEMKQTSMLRKDNGYQEQSNLPGFDTSLPRIHNRKIQSSNEANSQTTQRPLAGTAYYTIQSAVSMQDTSSDIIMLGKSNPDVAVNNPMKGLLGNPRWNAKDGPINSTLEYYNIGLDEVMFADPTIVGSDYAFDWSVTDSILQDAASRYKHAIWRFVAHEPGKPIKVPSYLLEAGIEIYKYNETTDFNENVERISLNYGDLILLEAFEQFISALGERYNDDFRLAFVQIGLLGFWGEGHTQGTPEEMIPENVPELIVSWYRTAFQDKQLQAWYPMNRTTNNDDNTNYTGIGYIDDSFAYSTLDGIYNGNTGNRSWFFWPTIVENGFEQFWQTGVMGGETRPELQDTIFQYDYPSGTEWHQDFTLCVDITHATYMLHQLAFRETSFTPDEIDMALLIHARMGYNFYITEVKSVLGAAIAAGDRDNVHIDVNIKQSGVAPFYYPLNLQLECPDIATPITVAGVHEIIAPSDEKTFRFRGVPASKSCLSNIQLSLTSDYLYPERPIKFAQDGINAKTGGVDLSIPVPTADEWDNAIKGVISGITLMDTGGTDSFRTESTPIGEVKNGDTFDLAEIGSELSLRCDVDNATASIVTSVFFKWEGITKEITSGGPWAMNGLIQDNFVPVEYLSSPGDKTVGITAYSGSGSIIGFTEILFKLTDSRTKVPTTMTPTVSPVTTRSPVTLPPTPAIQTTNPPISPPTTPPSTRMPTTNTPTEQPENAIYSFTLMNTGFMFNFPIQEINDGDTIVLDPNYSEYSIRCDTGPDVDKVLFHWDGQSHFELKSPWAMNGRKGNLFDSVPYLRSFGNKTIMAAAFSKQTIIGNLTISFSMIPDRTLPVSQQTKLCDDQPINVYQYYDCNQSNGNVTSVLAKIPVT